MRIHYLIVASTYLSVQIGVVVVTDIFGFKIPNGKYIGKLRGM